MGKTITFNETRENKSFSKNNFKKINFRNTSYEKGYRRLTYSERKVKRNLKFNTKETEVKVNEECLKQLIQMGFNKEHSIKALKEKKNNVNEALEYMLSNPMPEPKIDFNLLKPSKKFIGKSKYDNYY